MKTVWIVVTCRDVSFGQCGGGTEEVLVYREGYAGEIISPPAFETEDAALRYIGNEKSQKAVELQVLS